MYPDSVKHLDKFYIHKSRYGSVMSTRHDRLRIARLQAGYKRMTDAVKALGWKQPAYKGHENGNAVYSYDAAKQYGEAYGVIPAWLYDDDYRGPMRWNEIAQGAASQLIPLAGYVAANGEEHYITDYEAGDAGDFISASLQDIEVAYTVRGPSMLPRYRDGDIVLAGGQTSDPSQWLHHDVVVHVRGSNNRMLKTLKPGRNGLWSLKSINPVFDTIEDVELTWVAPVKYVKV
jgi:phage repressor protein C with HTH and peptisase S24 domain